MQSKPLDFWDKPKYLSFKKNDSYKSKTRTNSTASRGFSDYNDTSSRASVHSDRKDNVSVKYLKEYSKREETKRKKVLNTTIIRREKIKKARLEIE